MTKDDTKFVVESNVSLRTARKYNSKYPFHEMKIGDSFSFPSSNRNNVNSAAAIYKKNNKDFNFTSKEVWDEENSLGRLWRIAVSKPKPKKKKLPLESCT